MDSEERIGDFLTRDELKHMHQLGRRKSVLDDVTLRFGCNCVNCGASEGIRYHHIVPLSAGGTNNPTNIVPLCEQCHLNLHAGVIVDISKYANLAGRKRIVPTEKMISTFRDYLDCKIPKSIASARLGLVRLDINSNAWMRDELKRRGVEKFKNLLEVKLSNSTVHLGDCIGWQILSGQKESKKFIYAEREITADEFGLKMRGGKCMEQHIKNAHKASEVA